MGYYDPAAVDPLAALIGRAQAFNIDIPTGAMPNPGGPMSAAPPPPPSSNALGAGPLVREAPSAANVTAPAMTDAGATAQARAQGIPNIGALMPSATQGMFAKPGGSDGFMADASKGIQNSLVQNALAKQQPPHGKILGMDRNKFFQVIATVLAGFSDASNARNGHPTNLVGQLVEQAQYRDKLKREEQQRQGYVSALVAGGMDPNMAVVLAADPQEMAKHIGTRFDAATIDEGSSRYVPNLSGTANVFTAPKTFQNGSDVVQMPGSTQVAPIPMGTAPEALGAPTNVPGLRTQGEQYAGSLGFQPGSPEYTGAVTDFSLKGYGPSARGLLADRLAAQRAIAAGHDSASRYRVDHPRPQRGAAQPNPKPPTPTTVIGGIMDKQAHGVPLTASEQATLKDYRTHYKPQPGGVQISPNEPQATGPHGEVLVVRGGVWVNSATGKPVK